MALAPRFRYRHRRGKEGEFYPNRLREQSPTSEVDENGNDFQVLALGQEQVTRVEATELELKVTVTGKDGAVLQTLVLPAKKRR